MSKDTKTNNAVDLNNLPHIKETKLFTRTVDGRMIDDPKNGQDYLRVNYEVEGWWHGAPISLTLDRDWTTADGYAEVLTWDMKTSSGGQNTGQSVRDRIEVLQAILADMVEVMDQIGYN